MKIIETHIGGKNAVLTSYLLDNSQELPNIQSRPAVLIFPGGGYALCSDREGEPIAMAYLAQGFHSFVLRYTVDPNENTFPDALEEAKAALTHLREHTEEYGIDAEKIVVAGFSAGGHLAACLGTMAEVKPNALILGYPVIQANWGREFGYELPGADEAVNGSTPPTFIFATQGDSLVPIENSLAFCLALARSGVPFEQHIFLTGRHGLSLATAAVSGGMEEGVNQDVQAWFHMSVRFLQNLWSDAPLFQAPHGEGRKLWIDAPVSNLLKNEDARVIFENAVPGISQSLTPGMMVTLRRIAEFSNGMITEELLRDVEDQLEQVLG